MNTAILKPAFVCSARDALKLQDGPWIQNLAYLLKTSQLAQVIEPDLQQDLKLMLQEFEEES